MLWLHALLRFSDKQKRCTDRVSLYNNNVYILYMELIWYKSHCQTSRHIRRSCSFFQTNRFTIHTYHIALLLASSLIVCSSDDDSSVEHVCLYVLHRSKTVTWQVLIFWMCAHVPTVYMPSLFTHFSRTTS